MSFRLIITDAADSDMRQSYRWLAERNRAAADRWRDSLVTSVRSLAENPERGPLAAEEELADLGIRELLIGKRSRVHRVFFRVREDIVEVLRVRHAAQDSLSGDDFGPADED